MSYTLKYHTVPISVPVSQFTKDLDQAHALVRAQLACAKDHPIFITYRRYRRGKNRCKFCGCKIGGRE